MDRYMRKACQLADNKRISGRKRQRYIPRNGSDSQNLDLVRAGQCQQYGDGVVLSGVGVDDDLARCHVASAAFARTVAALAPLVQNGRAGLRKSLRGRGLPA
jgi:hypothetical protein